METVLAIPDTHCPCMRDDFVEFLQEVDYEYGCTRYVHLGDLVDWHALSFHETEHGLESAQEEYRKAKEQVHKLSKAFPNVDWLIGNHDCLPMRKAATVGIGAELMRSYEEVWELPFGWEVHPRYHKLEIDGVLYQHGDQEKGGQSCIPAVKNAESNFQSLVQGHWHTTAGVQWFQNHKHLVFGMQPGTGIVSQHPAMAYAAKNAKKPFNGCGVVSDGFYPTVIPMDL